MRKQQAGFTLIELIMVIVILGILAATAIPKFVDLSSEAEAAAVQGVAGAMTAAAAVNYAARSANPAKGVSFTGADNAAVCTEAKLSTIMAGGFPAGYTLAAGTTALADGVAYCKVSKGSAEQDDVPLMLVN